VTVWAGLGVVVLSVLAYGFLKSPGHARPFGTFFLLVLGGLVFAGVGLDMLNAWEPLTDKALVIEFLSGGVEVLEDGGEMIIGSVGCGGALAAYRALSRDSASPVRGWPNPGNPSSRRSKIA